jgi:hypothetical protein
MTDHDDYDISHLRMPRKVIALVVAFAVVEVVLLTLVFRGCWT